MTRRPAGGFSLIEMLAFTFVLSLVTIGVVSLTIGAARSTDRQSTESSIVNGGRTAIDEILRETRAASSVQVSRSIGGVTYNTNANSTLVLAAPGYNSSGVLDNVTDYIAFRYDSTTRRLTKSVMPGAGSQRASMSNFTVAKRVQSVAYTYRVRESFDAAGSTSFVLQANSTTAPLAYVNGTPVGCSYVNLTRTVTVPSATSGSNVQILYTINPTASAGTALRYATGIDLTITLSDIDKRQVTRTVTVTGAARLRNRRT